MAESNSIELWFIVGEQEETQKPYQGKFQLDKRNNLFHP